MDTMTKRHPLRLKPKLVRELDEMERGVLLTLQVQARLMNSPSCPKATPESPCMGFMQPQCGLCTRHHNEICGPGLMASLPKRTLQ